LIKDLDSQITKELETALTKNEDGNQTIQDFNALIRKEIEKKYEAKRKVLEASLKRV
jgi:hypothetical protein